MRYDRATLIRYGLWLLLAVIVALAVGYVSSQVYTWLYSAALIPEVDKRIATENEVFRTVTQILGGLFFLVTAVFTWRTVRASETTAQTAQDNIRIAQENLKVSQDSQITERFTRAIEQLGDDTNLPKILGGIYALERIARDSERDHWPIMEVLTAYVREKAARPVTSTGVHIDSVGPPSSWRSIQAILTVIGRRVRTYGTGEEHSLDLMNTDLRWTSLNSAHLEGAYLSDATLKDAVLREAHLMGAFLMGTNLEAADLWRANLEGAYLKDAQLAGVKLTGANLKGADLELSQGLTAEQLNSALYDETTKLPPHLKQTPPYQPGSNSTTVT